MSKPSSRSGHIATRKPVVVPPSLGFGRLSRRRFMRHFAVGAAGASILPALGCSSVPDLEPMAPDVAPLPYPDWIERARVANFTAWLDIEPEELATFIHRSEVQNLSVLEIDLGLYFYEPRENFDQKMKLLDQVAKAAHKRGMRCVAYYAAGEVVTIDADKRPDSMSRDNPGWLQVGLDGLPVSFTGGGVVHWIKEGMESAWMCPTSGFADYYLDRARAVAKTAVDGLWIDVPLFPDEVTPLPCTNATCAALFKEETGFNIPTLPKGAKFAATMFDDAVFRRWIRWRHEILHRWLLRITTECEKVRPDFKVIVETVTCDHNRATRYGLDAGFADESKLYRVFEISPVSNKIAMRGGFMDDWLSLVGMMKYARGAAAPKSAWGFTYGYQPDDAEYVMGIALNAGVSPFECKIPDMTMTVDPAYRTRVFRFIADNQDIQATVDIAPVAVIHSSASRDFLDRNKGQGIHFSHGDEEEGFGDADLTENLDYMGDYRGVCRALIHAHVPHQIVTEFQITAERLAPFKLVVVPSALALSDEAIAALDGFAMNGGTLLITGPDAGLYTLLGAKRANEKLLRTFQLSPLAVDWQTVMRGKGTIIHHPRRIGLEYLRTDDPAILDRFAKAAEAAKGRITSNAPLSTLLDLRRAKDGSKLYLFATSLDGLGKKDAGPFAPKILKFFVRFPLGGLVPTKVITTSLTAGAPKFEIPFDVKDDEITFELEDVGSLVVATVHA